METKHGKIIQITLFFIMGLLIFSCSNQKNICIETLKLHKNERGVGSDVIEIVFQNPDYEKLDTKDFTGLLKIGKNKYDIYSFNPKLLEGNKLLLEYQTSDFIYLSENKFEQVIANKKITLLINKKDTIIYQITNCFKN